MGQDSAAEFGMLTWELAGQDSVDVDLVDRPKADDHFVDVCIGGVSGFCPEP